MLNDPKVLKKLRIPPKMYHVTERKNVPSILKRGLTTRGAVQEGEQEITRGIYLSDASDIFSILQNQGDIDLEDPVLLEVDTRQLKLRLDPEYYPGDISAEEYVQEVNDGMALWALYSRKPIPPGAIRVKGD